jgi:hypothetical protein
MTGCPVMWCEIGGGTGCGDGDSTVDNNNDNNDNILTIAGNTNLEYDSILQAPMHKSCMLVHKLN